MLNDGYICLVWTQITPKLVSQGEKREKRNLKVVEAECKYKINWMMTHEAT